MRDGRWHGSTARFSRLIVIARGQKSSRRSSNRASLWSRLFVAVTFAFYLNYVPVHLATHTHLDDAMAAVAQDDDHHDAHDDADADRDGGHHTPHPAADHALTLTTQTKSPSAAFTVFLLPADTAVTLWLPKPQPPLPVFERIRPPGESPPDPLQPRAPPLA